MFVRKFKVIVLLIALIGIFQLNAGERVLGREIVEIGEYNNFSGTVFFKHGEWFLRVSDNIVYELHLGNKDHQKRISFEMRDGMTVSVNGFLYEDDIAVVSIEIEGELYSFRDRDGSPLWSGQGEHRNVRDN